MYQKNPMFHTKNAIGKRILLMISTGLVLIDVEFVSVAWNNVDEVNLYIQILLRIVIMYDYFIIKL